MYTSSSIENELRGTVGTLANLLERDTGVAEAYLCDSRVQHVFKLPREGAFCGYRNCQMMLSLVLNARWPGYETIVAAVGGNPSAPERPIPNILELQHLIEQAWDAGFNRRCRTETGGILNTRKYIGTPECKSLLSLLQIPTSFTHIHDVSFPDKTDPRNGLAHEHLFDTVETYFRSHRNNNQHSPTSSGRIHTTKAPPIYFQQPGHSMTIIGLEKRSNGQRNLLVLDPGFGPSKGIRTLLERQEAGSDAAGPSRQPRSAPAANKSTAYPPSSSGAAYLRREDGKLDGWIRPKNPQHPTSQRGGDNAASSSRGFFSERGRQGGYGGRNDSENARKLLEGYRRGVKHLRRHREFEVLMLAPGGAEVGG